MSFHLLSSRDTYHRKYKMYYVCKRYTLYIESHTQNSVFRLKFFNFIDFNLVERYVPLSQRNGYRHSSNFQHSTPPTFLISFLFLHIVLARSPIPRKLNKSESVCKLFQTFCFSFMNIWFEIIYGDWFFAYNRGINQLQTDLYHW